MRTLHVAWEGESKFNCMCCAPTVFSDVFDFLLSESNVDLQHAALRFLVAWLKKWGSRASAPLSIDALCAVGTHVQRDGLSDNQWHFIAVDTVRFLFSISLRHLLVNRNPEFF